MIISIISAKLFKNAVFYFCPILLEKQLRLTHDDAKNAFNLCIMYYCDSNVSLFKTDGFGLSVNIIISMLQAIIIMYHVSHVSPG